VDPIRSLARAHGPCRPETPTQGRRIFFSRPPRTTCCFASPPDDTTPEHPPLADPRSFSTLKAPDVFPERERAAMEDGGFASNPRVGGFDKPPTHFTGGRRHGRRRPLSNPLLRATPRSTSLRSTQPMCTSTSAARIIVWLLQQLGTTTGRD
jgi:hypothetical protein